MAEEKEKKPFKTSIGGQALIEGIMMNGPKRRCIAVRSGDEIITKSEEITPLREKHPILGIPVLRGIAAFLSSMIVGVKAITYSAEFLPEEEQGEPDKVDEWIERHFSEEKAKNIILGIAVFLGIAMSVGLFFMLPTVIAGFFAGYIESSAGRNILESVIRIAIFIGYIKLVSGMKEISRMWQYHGAEHKTIFCYEAGLDLTVENVRPQSRLHPRCGTSFLLITMVVSILVFAFISWDNVFVRMGMRILLLPLVVGISYEILRIAGRYDNIATRIISAPGKALQRLTTAEPDDSMIEVAIAAMKDVIPEERGTDIW